MWQAGGLHGGVLHEAVFLPHSPDMGEFLHAARLAGLLEHDAPLDVPQLAVGLLSVADGALPQVLAALGVRAPALRAAIAETGEPGGA